MGAHRGFVAWAGVLVIAGCQPPRIERVAVEPGELLFTAAGQARAISASAYDARGGRVGQAGTSFVSSDPAVVAIDANGLVRAVRSGSATVHARMGGKAGEARVEVRIPAQVQVLPRSLALEGVGSSLSLDVQVLDELGRPIAGAAAQVTSADDAIATVRGLSVTATGAGTTRLTAAFGSIAQVIDVTVPAP